MAFDKIKQALSSNKDETTTTTTSSSSGSTSPVKVTNNSSSPSTTEVKTKVGTTPISDKYAEKKGTTVKPKEVEASSTVQTQQTVAPVTHNVIQREETEEVTRAREHEKHLHHVQHHVQPVKDKEVRDEVHHTNIAPTTVIKENVAATAEDAAAYESLGNQFKDTETHADTKRSVVDRGEQVQVKEHHHVHNVIQPVIEKETHDRHRIHTTVPIHHITHEAPIVHSSINHEPLNMEDFLKRGGSLASNATHTDVGKHLLSENGATSTAEGAITADAASATKKSDIADVNAATSKLKITA